VIEAIGKEQVTQPDPVPQQPPKPERSLRDTSKLHNEILSRLGPSPVAEDQLIRDLELPSQKVAPELLNLELDGKIIRAPGGLLSLAH